MESRIYAEDPYRKFLPSIGRLVRYAPPPEGHHEGDRGAFIVRNDTGVREGDEISMFYDPMIAKLCTWAPDRAGAVTGMALALESLNIEGVGHNAPFLSAVMDQPRFASGALSTSYIADEFPEGFRGLPPSAFQRDLILATACAMHHILAARARRIGNGFTAPLARADWVAVIGREHLSVRIVGDDDGLELRLPDEGRTLLLEGVAWRPGARLFAGRLDGHAFTATVAPGPEGFVIRHRAATAKVLILTPLSAELHERLPPKTPPDTSRLVVSPMPGLVVSLGVVAGDEVKAGQVICIIEAMKMQNILRAERDGVIKSVGVAAGDSVAADDVLAEFA